MESFKIITLVVLFCEDITVNTLLDRYKYTRHHKLGSRTNLAYLEMAF